jgi:hypothetical protein
MGNASAIKAGAAYVELFLKDNRLTSGLKTAEKSFKSWGGSLMGIGGMVTAGATAALAPILGAAKVFADMGGPLTDMSARTGIGVEALQELGFAAKMVGGDMTSIEPFIRKMQKTLGEAAGGSALAAEVFDDFGLSVSAMLALSPEDQLKVIADKLAGIADPAKKTAAALEIFGKSGTGMLPMMAEGSAGMERFALEARKAGIVLSKDDVAAADALGDSMDKMGMAMKSAYAKIGAALAPALTDLAEKIVILVAAAGNWIRENSGLITTIAMVAAGIGAAGIVIAAVGGAMNVLGTIAGAISIAFSLASAAIGIMGTVLAAVLSPIGLVITGVVAAGAAILYFTGLGGKALGWLGGVFGGLAKTAKESFGGIKDALAVGDFALAAKILWTTLKSIWAEGTGWLNEIWIGAKHFMLDAWTNVFYGVAELWTSTVATMTDAWHAFANAIVGAWMWAQKMIAKGIGWILAKIRGLDPSEVLAGIDQEYGAASSDRNNAAAAEKEKREAAKEEALRGYAKNRQSEFQSNQAGANAAVAASRAEIDRLNAERRALIDQAKRAREERDRNAGLPMQSWKQAAERQKQELADARTTTVGTFSGAAAAMMGWGGGSAADRTAKATEQTAINTKKLADWGRGAGQGDQWE